MASENLSSSTTSAAKDEGRSPGDAGSRGAEGLADDQVLRGVSLGRRRPQTAHLPGGARGDMERSRGNLSGQRQSNATGEGTSGGLDLNRGDISSQGQSSHAGKNSTDVCQGLPRTWYSLYNEANGLFRVSRRHLASSLQASVPSRLELDSMQESVRRMELQLRRARENGSASGWQPGCVRQDAWASPPAEDFSGRRSSSSRASGIQRSPPPVPRSRQLDEDRRSQSHMQMEERKNQRNLERSLSRLYGGSYSACSVGSHANIYDFAEPVIRTPRLVQSDLLTGRLSSRVILPDVSFMDFAGGEDCDFESISVDDSLSEDEDDLSLPDDALDHSSLLQLHEEISSHRQLGRTSSARSAIRDRPTSSMNSLWQDYYQVAAASEDQVWGSQQSALDLTAFFSDTTWPRLGPAPPSLRVGRAGSGSRRTIPTPETGGGQTEDVDSKGIPPSRSRRPLGRRSSLKAVRRTLFRRLDAMEPTLVNEIMLALDRLEPEDLYGLALMPWDALRQTMREVAANLAASFERDDGSDVPPEASTDRTAE